MSQTRVPRVKATAAKTSKKDSILPRRTAKQARSADTIDVILEGAARVLRAEGYEKFTTNAVAERAGVSVGSLYQYFPNKDALVGALLIKFHGAQAERLSAALKATAHLPLADAARTLISMVVEFHLEDPVLHRVLDKELPRIGDIGDILEFLHQNITTPVRDFLAARKSEVGELDIDFAAFVITHSIQPLMHRLDETGQSARRLELVDMLTAMVLGVVQAAQPPVKKPGARRTSSQYGDKAQSEKPTR